MGLGLRLAERERERARPRARPLETIEIHIVCIEPIRDLTCIAYQAPPHAVESQVTTAVPILDGGQRQLLSASQAILPGTGEMAFLAFPSPTHAPGTAKSKRQPCDTYLARNRVDGAHQH